MNTEEFKTLFLQLIKEDKDFREIFIDALRYDNNFIAAVGGAYRDYEDDCLHDEAQAWC